MSNRLIEVGRTKGFLRGPVAAIREIKANRDLLRMLIGREIKSRYKNSALGLVWSLVRPLVQLLVYYVFIGHILGAARSIPDFAIFVFAGITMWGFFSEIVQGGTDSIITNQGLVKKVYLPRELFPLSAAGSAIFNFLVQFAVLLVASIILGAAPIHWDFFLIVPAFILVLVFGLALGLTLSAVNVYLRDMEHLVGVGLMLGFWASPIVYSMNFVHSAIGGTWLETLYLLNPVTLAIIAMQKAVWIAGAQDPNQSWPADLGFMLIISILLSCIVLFLSQKIFSRLQGNFAQEL